MEGAGGGGRHRAAVWYTRAHRSVRAHERGMARAGGGTARHQAKNEKENFKRFFKKYLCVLVSMPLWCRCGAAVVPPAHATQLGAAQLGEWSGEEWRVEWSGV